MTSIHNQDPIKCFVGLLTDPKLKDMSTSEYWTVWWGWPAAAACTDGQFWFLQLLCIGRWVLIGLIVL